MPVDKNPLHPDVKLAVRYFNVDVPLKSVAARAAHFGMKRHIVWASQNGRPFVKPMDMAYKHHTGLVYTRGDLSPTPCDSCSNGPGSFVGCYTLRAHAPLQKNSLSVGLKSSNIKKSHQY